MTPWTCTVGPSDSWTMVTAGDSAATDTCRHKSRHSKKVHFVIIIGKDGVTSKCDLLQFFGKTGIEISVELHQGNYFRS